MAAKKIGFQAFIVSAMRAGSGVVLLALNLIVGRALGADASALLVLAITTLAVLSAIATFGATQVLTRLLSTTARGQATPQIVSRFIACTVMPTSLVVAVLAAVGFSLGADGTVEGFMRVVLAALPASAGLTLLGGAFNGMRMPVRAEVATRTGFLCAVLLVVSCALSLELGTASLGWAVVLASWATFLVVALMWRRASTVRSQSLPAAALRLRRLITMGLPLLAASLVTLLPPWLDVLLLTAMTSLSDAGVYAVATRITALIGLVLVGVAAVAGPRISRSFAEQDSARLQSILAIANAYTVVPALGMALILVLFRDFWLSFFGVEFTAGTTVLVVSAVSQLLHVSFGLVTLTLVMTGQQTQVLLTSVIVLAVGLVGNIVLIPLAGINGAAFASLLAVTTSNTVGSMLLWRRLRIRPFVFRFRIAGA